MTRVLVENKAPVVKKPQLTTGIFLKDADLDTVKWVQQQLAKGGYLDRACVDGIDCLKTYGALAKFKQDFYLQYPNAIGPTTLDLLAKIEEKRAGADQPEIPALQVNEEAGSNTGRSTRLPVVGKIYENEMVVAGTHITWGELTRGLTRLPVQTAEFGTTEEVVGRLLTLAKVFGKVRAKFGSPIAINSAYRPPNLKIGALYSQHKYGRALDVRPLNGDYDGLIRAIKAVPEVKGIGRGGPGYGFWHMDIRPISKRVYFDC